MEDAGFEQCDYEDYLDNTEADYMVSKVAEQDEGF